jgi:hypothetical protein
MNRYQGSCHCGAIRFSVDAELEGIEICNCSLCSRLGYVHLYVEPEEFQLETPEVAFATYQFGTRTSRNHFCKTCGISPFRRARSDPDRVDVNVRCLEGVDADALPSRAFDGQNWEKAMGERER